MGESGVGKTALIKYMVEIIMQNKFLQYNVHAGIY
jgi:ABC-type transporter Mla maintaining outer membrane lipid asymmetry ATPase subunit MlaF